MKVHQMKKDVLKERKVISALILSECFDPFSPFSPCFPFSCWPHMALLPFNHVSFRFLPCPLTGLVPLFDRNIFSGPSVCRRSLVSPPFCLFQSSKRKEQTHAKPEAEKNRIRELRTSFDYVTWVQ
jgi:hypothetical protein